VLDIDGDRTERAPGAPNPAIFIEFIIVAGEREHSERCGRGVGESGDLLFGY
jgi:hypothetical protein